MSDVHYVLDALSIAEKAHNVDGSIVLRADLRASGTLRGLAG